MNVGRFTLQRCLALLPTLFFVSVLVFLLQHLLPGDPAAAMVGDEGDQATIEQIRQKYGFDQPLPVQYLNWITGVISGDFGESLRSRMAVWDLVISKLPVTIQLAVMAMLIALLIGIPAGIVAALYRGKWPDTVANTLALSGISVPNFWLGIMLILLISVNLQWLPASGYVPIWEDFGQSMRTMIMPAFVLGTAVAGIIMRHTRGAMIQVLSSDYIRTAYAKGLVERKVILKHALRNALVPVITLTAIEFGQLLSGAVLTEQIFSIPGFGKLIVDAVFNRDYAVVQGVVLVSAVLFILLNLLADILYFVVNPRMRG